VLRALASRDLPSHLHPGCKIIVPGDVRLAALHLTATDLGGSLGPNQHTARRCGGFGKTGNDLDPQPAAGQRAESIEAALVEIDGGSAAVDPRWLRGEGELGDLDEDRPLREEDHGSFCIGIAAVGNGIKAQGGVLVEPHRIAVSQDDLHPRLTGGVHAIAADQRHIDDCFETFLLTHRLHGRVALEVRNVAQRGHLVLARGHRYAAKRYSHSRNQDLFHGPPPGRPKRVQLRCQNITDFEFGISNFEFATRP
jgi:hypothetical protein